MDNDKKLAAEKAQSSASNKLARDEDTSIKSWQSADIPAIAQPDDKNKLPAVNGKKPAGGKLAQRQLATPRRKRRKGWIYGSLFVVALALGVGGYFIFFSGQTTSTVLPQTNTVNSVSVVGLTVGATGQVQAKADISLSFSSGGTVTQVLAKQGDIVKKGDPIAKVDDKDLQLSLKTAQSSLNSAKASYEKLKAGSTPEQIQTAQEQVKQAEIKVQTTKNGNSLPGDIQNAQAQLDSAKAKLALLQAGPDAATLSSAQSTYDQAQTNFDKTKSSLYSALVGAQVSRDQALTALNTAQDTYNTQYNNDHNPDGTLKSTVKDADLQTETADLRALQNAQGNYNKADISLNDANVAYNTGLKNAQSTLDNAKIQLDKVKAGSTDADIAAAQASVDSAQANLNKLTAPSTQNDITAAESNLRISQLSLQTLLDGPTASDLAVSQASLDNAQATVDKAQTALDNATLKAPFDGILSSLTVIPGQTVSAGTAVAQITDMSQLHVDVSVGESDITKIQLNQPVTLSFDAISGRSFTGKITFISPKATVTSNVVSYLVTATLDGQGENSLQVAYPEQYQKFLDSIRQQFQGRSRTGTANGTPGAQTTGGSNGAPAGQSAEAQTTTAETQPAGQGFAGQAGSGQIGQAGGRQGGFAALSGSSATQLRSSVSFCGYTPSTGTTTTQNDPKVGMTATVTVCLNVKAGVMAVPTRAIQTKIIENRPVSYVVVLLDDKGTKAEKAVTVGLKGDSTSEISGGDLKDGDKVIISSTPTNTGSSSNNRNATNILVGGGGGGGIPAGAGPGR